MKPARRRSLKKPQKCFECSNRATVLHHVVPYSLGGTNTVPLCPQCHAKVHDVSATTTSALTRRALRLKAQNGEFTGGRVPYGFDVSQRTGRLTKNKEEQAIITKVARLRQKGVSLRKIADTLHKAGHRTRCGAIFHANTVKRMLHRHDAQTRQADLEDQRMLYVRVD